MPKKDPIDIFFVEDSDVLRFCLRNFVERVSDFHLIGEAANGVDGVEQILATHPAVALIDIGLPDLDGISVARRIKAALPETKVLMLTASDDEKDIFESLDAGADGYVLKGEYSTNLEMAVRSVRVGAVWLDPGIAKLVLKRAQGSAKNQLVSERTGFTSDDMQRLDQVAASDCKDGVCLVEPEFMTKLRGLNKPVPDKASL